MSRGAGGTKQGSSAKTNEDEKIIGRMNNDSRRKMRAIPISQSGKDRKKGEGGGIGNGTGKQPQRG